MKIVSATFHDQTKSLVDLTFSDGSRFAIYPDDGSEEIYADILLKQWLADGNFISDPE
jgi:hypothetical protein